MEQTVEQWIRSKFDVRTVEQETEDGPVSYEVFLFESGGVQVEAKLEPFLSAFGNASPSLQSLKAQDPEDRRGWHRHFDAWDEQGLFD